VLATGLLNAPSLRDVRGILSLTVVAMWTWMVWSGVYLWPHRTVQLRAVARTDIWALRRP
jgi:hypothetical protein